MSTCNNPPELCWLSAPEPSRTSSAIRPGTLRNLPRYLHRNPLEPHQLSAPEPSETSSAICAGMSGTLRNLVCYLHRNPPEPHPLSAPELSGTSSAICTGTLRNLTSNLQNPPEPSPEPGLAAAPDRTELFWAKDPTAIFGCWGKTSHRSNHDNACICPGLVLLGSRSNLRRWSVSAQFLKPRIAKEREDVIRCRLVTINAVLTRSEQILHRALSDATVPVRP